MVHFTLQNLPLKGESRPENLQSMFNLVTFACIKGPNETSVLNIQNPFIKAMQNDISNLVNNGMIFYFFCVLLL